MFDVEFARSQFPAFADSGLQGWSFFENAGGSYTCQQVIDRLYRFYTKNKVQPYAAYPASTEAGEQMDESYAAMARYLGLQASEIHFGPSTSQNTYVLAKAFSAVVSEGDNIIVTNQDHEANSGVWRRLAGQVTVREWCVDPDTGQLNPDDLANLLDDRTRLVTFPHCSNIVAHINPVQTLCSMIRDAGAISVVDGVSYSPHGLPDVAALGADVYLFSTYKTYGPHQGLMAVRDEILQLLPNQGHYFNEKEAGKRLTPAGPDHAQVAAVAGIAEYFDALAQQHVPNASAEQHPALVRDLLTQHEQHLLAPLLDYLSSRNDCRVLGPTDALQRAPTVAFVHNNLSSATLAGKLHERQIMCDAGHFYAKRLVEAMGVDADAGVVRVSFVHYTSQQEIDRLIGALDTALSR